MKIAIVVVVVLGLVVVIGALVILRGNRSTPETAGTELTPGETIIRDLVREVYDGNITREQIRRDGADAIFLVELQNESLKELQINLTSLAEKHKDGASLAALKSALRYD